MGEQRAAPGAGQHQQHDRGQPVRGAAEQTAGAMHRVQAAQAEQRGQQVAQVPHIHRRQQAFGQRRDQVEQTAVQIEVLVLEGRQVGQAGGVVVEQQAAIDVLHLFVIAQAVLAETVQHVEDEGDGQQGGGEAAKSGWNHGEGVEEVSVRSTHDPALR